MREAINVFASAIRGKYENILCGYSFTSYTIIIALSLITAGLLIEKKDKNTKNEKMGIIGLNGEIKKMIDNKKLTNESKSNESNTFIGINKSKKKVFCNDKRHTIIAGTTGSGKTVALSNLIKHAVEHDCGTLIIDGKGDIANDSLLEITKGFCDLYNKKLIVIDMNNPHTSGKYNPFADASETVCKDMLINLSNWSEEHYKLNTERYLQRVIKMINKAGISLDFNTIINYIDIDKFKSLSTYLEKEKIILKVEHLENLKIAEKSALIAENASARFATMAESDIAEIFDAQGYDIYDALIEKSVILFILNPLIYPETSTLLGRLILIDAKKAVSNLFCDESRKFFILDEINVYASTALTDLINKSRSANVTCFPAFQSLADLEMAVDEYFKMQIIENCNNYIIMRQNSFRGAEEWAKTIGTEERMNITYQLSETEATGKGTAKKTREFCVHPDEIKSLRMGEAIFYSKDTMKIERIKVNKPF